MSVKLWKRQHIDYRGIVIFYVNVDYLNLYQNFNRELHFTRFKHKYFLSNEILALTFSSVFYAFS